MPRCADCGYLGLREKQTNSVVEANQAYRSRGTFLPERTSGLPYCAKNVFPLNTLAVDKMKELSRGTNADGTAPEAIAATLNEERECLIWTEYIPLHSPKDHDHMIWQKLALDTQSRIADVQSQIAQLHNKTLEWREQQAVSNDALTKRLAALELVKHNETLGIGKQQVDAAKWQAITNIIVAAATIVSLAISIFALWKVSK